MVKTSRPLESPSHLTKHDPTTTARVPQPVFDVIESHEAEDSRWDTFLEATPLGQFEQSSGWARIKTNQGWQSHRYLLSHNDQWVGGFQILERKSRVGRIGYVSKGPVLLEDDEPAWSQGLVCLQNVARKLKLRAIVVKPPDLSRVDAQWLLQQRFQHERFMGVINASLWLDLEGTPDSLIQRMPGYNRSLIRQATRKGVVVREGGEDDLEEFFALMMQSCRRQKSRPNPPTLHALRCVWRKLPEQHPVRLAFADHGGKALAALITVSFGERITLWKKGWSDDSGSFRPNHLLYYDALCWGQRSGFKFCDFGSLDREIAQALLANKELTEQQRRSRDRFHLGFGGYPVLLPEAFIYLPNRLSRTAYKAASLEIVRALADILHRA